MPLAGAYASQYSRTPRQYVASYTLDWQSYPHLHTDILTATFAPLVCWSRSQSVPILSAVSPPPLAFRQGAPTQAAVRAGDVCSVASPHPVPYLPLPRARPKSPRIGISPCGSARRSIASECAGWRRRRDRGVLPLASCRCSPPSCSPSCGVARGAGRCAGAPSRLQDPGGCPLHSDSVFRRSPLTRGALVL